MERIDAMLARADLFAAIGTSGTVHPASRVVEQARAAGARTVGSTCNPPDVGQLSTSVSSRP